jgi:predicted TIM-barrel fold metal-dependent hydrolase
MTKSKIKLTRDQKQALVDYEYQLRQEDRYLGSVFVTPQGQREVEEKRRRAYERCVSLGMTPEHGL